jgi:hypothetical protein
MQVRQFPVNESINHFMDFDIPGTIRGHASAFFVTNPRACFISLLTLYSVIMKTSYPPDCIASDHSRHIFQRTLPDNNRFEIK